MMDNVMVLRLRLDGVFFKSNIRSNYLSGNVSFSQMAPRSYIQTLAPFEKIPR